MNNLKYSLAIVLIALGVIHLPCAYGTWGGPDGYGYRFYDNIAPDTTPYDWIELRDDPGTTWINSWATNHDDGYSYEGPTDPGARHPIGFAFPFYESSHDSFRVCTNGFIQFTTTSASYSNADLPASAVAGPAIFPYWDDLHLDRIIAGGTDVVGYKNFGTYTVIEFDSIGFNNTLCTAPNNRLKYEVILYNDGKIKIQYNIVDVCDAQDSSMTVGIQSHGAPGSAALMYGSGTGAQGAMVLGGNLPASGRAIWFTRMLPTHDFACSTIVSPSGIQVPSSYVNVTGQFNNYGSIGEDSPVQYQFNGGAIVSEQTSVVAPSGGSETYTFATQILMPAESGVYPLAMWADLSFDEERRNDTMRVNVQVNWDGFACGTAIELTTAGPDSLPFNNCGAGTNDPGVPCTPNSYDDMVFVRTVDAGHTVSFWISSLTWASKYPDLALRWGGVCPGNTLVDCIATNSASQYLKHFTWTNSTGLAQDAYFVVGHYTGTTAAYCGNFTLAWQDEICLSVNPPLTEGFESVPYVPVLPNCWTQENSNATSPVWESFGSNPRTGTTCGSISGLAAGNNDWLFSPGIYMEEGSDYSVSYWRRVGSTSYPDWVEVKAGLTPTESAMTIQVAAFDTCRLTTYANKLSTFVCPESGVYFIGWHNATLGSSARTYIDDITIVLSTACTGGNVTVNSVTAADSVALTATLDGGWSGGTPRYQWYTDIGCVNGNQIPAATFSTFQTYTSSTYSCRVYVIDSVNCAACDSAIATVIDCITPATLPFQEGFDNVMAPTLPNCWSQENTDNALPVWETSASSPHSAPNLALLGSPTYVAMNDWLFSPVIQLSADTTYLLEFYVGSAPFVWINMEVKYGTSPSSGGMTAGTILSQFSINYSGYGLKSNRFTPPSDGTYYIGWHGSSTDAVRIAIDDIRIVAIAPCAEIQNLASPLPISVSGNTTGETNDFNLASLGFPVETPPCWQSPSSPARYSLLGCFTGPDLAYAWTPEETGIYRIELESGTNYDADFLIFHNTCPNVPVYTTDFICGSDDWGSDRSHIDLEFAAGESYLIVVGGHNSGPFTLTIDLPGRCCYGDPAFPSCAVNTEEQCNAISGAWTAGEPCMDCRPIQVHTPNGGENWVEGEMNTIRWVRGSAATGDVSIEIKRNFPTGIWEQIVASTPNSGSYDWLVTAPVCSTARIRVMSLSIPGAGDTSDFEFYISMEAGNAFALALDGSGDYVDCGNSTCLDLTVDMTLEAWVRFAALERPQTFVSKDAGSGGNNKWIFGWSQDYEPAYQRLILHQNGSCTDWGATSSVWIPTIGQWYHVAVVADSNSRTFYVDGASIGSASVLCNLPHVDAPVLIGQAEGQFNLSGTIGEVRIWDIPRSLSQIQANMNMRLAGNEPGLVGYWPLNESGGNVAHDFSACGNNGTLSGDARFIPSLIPVANSQLTVIVPNGGESWIVGSTEAILWNSGTDPGDIRIEIDRNYPEGNWETVVSNHSNSGLYNWLVSAPLTASARIRVTNILDSLICDTSDASFAVADPSITVISPNGGETWVVDAINNISWISPGVSGMVKIELNRSFPGGSWEVLADSTPDDGIDPWTVSGTVSSQARVRISSVATPTISDVSDNDFSVVIPTITLAIPNGSETWVEGLVNTITWIAPHLSENVKIELNRTYPGPTWETIFGSTPNDSTEPWTVTLPATTTARIRITGVTHISVGDTSDADFAIVKALTVTNPNGGEEWLVGDVDTITWVSPGVSGNVRIEIKRPYPTGSWVALASSTPDDGSEPWIVSGPVSDAARIRISTVASPLRRDTSDTDFAIAIPSIIVTAANGGEIWIAGEADTITWTSSNLSENVRIQLNRTYPGPTWETIFESTPNDSAEPWTVTLPATTNARIRITGVAHPFVGDTSDANFAIGARSLLLTVPNGGEVWSVGANQNITWISENLTGTVNLDINRHYPAGAWESLAAGTANSGMFPWTVTYPTSIMARVRLTSTSYPALSDTSNSNFTIGPPNFPPVMSHDPLHDQYAAPFTITAIVTDDAGGVVTRAFYKASAATIYDSVSMDATENPYEYAVMVGPLATGAYDYFLTARDALGLTTGTTVSSFMVANSCGTEQIYDDGTSERSNWASSPGYAWAVKFTVGSSPFVICDARVGLSATHPDVAHSPIEVRVLLADGPAGLPGTMVWTRTVGSIGNVVGGVAYPPANWNFVVIRDGSGNALTLTEDFFVAVSNPDSTRNESFLQDTASTYLGKSYVYDGCEGEWYNEDAVHASARVGNRMIRVSGYELIAPNVIIYRNGNDLQLSWNSTGAPFYQVYYSLTSGGTYTLMGNSSSTTFLDEGAVSNPRKFYLVRASTTP